MKVRVPETAPEKSAAPAWPAPPSPVTAQSTVAVALGFARVTVKVNGVVPTLPSPLLASVAAMEKLCAAAVVKSSPPEPMPAKLLPLVSLIVPFATVTW